MNEEIKETLKKLKKLDDLSTFDYKLLLDYITNLQEEKEKQHKGFLAVCKEAKDLEQRIDKATNYILENICCDTRVYTKNEIVYKVVDILRSDE